MNALVPLLLLVPVPSIGTALALWVLPGLPGKLAYFACKTWILLLPLFWRTPRPPAVRPRAGIRMGVGSGVAIGVLILLVGLLLERQIDTVPLRDLARRQGFDRPAVYLVFAAYLVIVNSLLEEYVWRFFVLGRCSVLMSGNTAVTVAALCFTLHHVVALAAYLSWGITLLASAGVFAGGAWWGWLYRRYGWIGPGYASHVLIDLSLVTLGWRLLFGN